ncbi:uncharacterized protein [Rutidosis leptorrhynchoides]|uniref:uncharacterized protein n=1 Tax=Rutidosis leptorrhynchoides TaxID=125765 RepID=UPI003A9A6192
MEPANKRKRPKSKSTSTTSSSSLVIPEPPQSLFPSKAEFLRVIAVLAIASSVAFACNFLYAVFNSAPKPFCDSDIDYSLSDFCEPCPSSGVCHEGKLDCFDGYRKQGNLCIEDGDISQTAKKLSEKIESRLCEAYAKFLCDGDGTVWVSENDVWNDIGGEMLSKNFGSDNSMDPYAKKKTMETIDRILETRISPNGIKELKCPYSLGEHYKPYTCHIQQWISQNVLIIVPVCALLLGCALLIRKVRQRRNLSVRVEGLYHQVCEILEENALASRDINGGCEPWIIASRLRDHLLLPKERKDHLLWKKVEDLVKEDSRVDQYPKLVKGESRVVWEWQVEGSLSSSAKRKKKETNMFLSSEHMGVNFDQRHHQTSKKAGGDFKTPDWWQLIP